MTNLKILSPKGIQLFFDEKGNLYMPKNLLFGGETTPKLKPIEWWVLVMDITKPSTYISNHIQTMFTKRQFNYAKKKLKDKGIICQIKYDKSL